LAEFAYNNSVTQVTKLTPFYTNYEYYLKTIWTSSEESKNPASKAYANWIKGTHNRAMQALERTKENMSKYYNQYHQPQLKYEEEDEGITQCEKHLDGSTYEEASNQALRTVLGTCQSWQTCLST
jgi:hypothetical protein